MQNYKNKTNEDAVSPVIAVIMMIAITVLLAAVISALIFGNFGSEQKIKIVAVTVKSIDATHVQIMNMGGPDVKDLTNITVSGDITAESYVGTNVGAFTTVETTPGTGNKRILVVGSFGDTQQVVLQDAAITRTVA
jgi:archaeal type IV pilus assembly protein PilA